MLHATLALTRKELMVNLRSPVFLAITVLVPVVFVSLYALVVEVSATNPIAVARYSQGPHSDALVRTLKEMHAVDGPFFRVLTIEPDTAQAQYRRGEVGGLLEIPSGFDDQLAAGQPTQVDLQVFNINSDNTKNLQLRLDHAVHTFQQAHADNAQITIQESTVFPHDMSIRTYLGTALLMFAVLFSAIVTTSTLITREWEERTAKLALLSPRGVAPLLLGKGISALLLTTVSVVLVLAALQLTLDYPVMSLGVTSVLYLAALFIYGATMGALLAAIFQHTLPVVPLAVVISVTHFFLSGYESYIRGLAHSGALAWLWRLSAWWPHAALTDGIRFQLTGFQPARIALTPLTISLLLSGLIGVPAWLLSRRVQLQQGQ